MQESAERFGIDPARLALGGASAGGNLAAGAVLRMLDHPVPDLPGLVVLVYPTLLAVQPAPDRDLRHALDEMPEADVFPPSAVAIMYSNYLGGAADSPPLAARQRRPRRNSWCGSRAR